MLCPVQALLALVHDLQRIELEIVVLVEPCAGEIIQAKTGSAGKCERIDHELRDWPLSPHALANVLVTEPVHLAVEEDLPALLGQRRHRRAVKVEALLRLEVLVRAGRRLYDFGRARLLNVIRDLSRLLRQAREREVFRDVEEERLRLLDGFARLGDPGAKIGFLGHVLDVLAAAQEAGEEFLEEGTVFEEGRGDRGRCLRWGPVARVGVAGLGMAPNVWSPVVGRRLLYIRKRVDSISSVHKTWEGSKATIVDCSYILVYLFGEL